jgi:hypothetical protein
MILDRFLAVKLACYVLRALHVRHLFSLKLLHVIRRDVVRQHEDIKRVY